jgi:pilus assembly protein Flp/PilA
MMWKFADCHRSDEAGASAVEYGLLVAAIAAVITAIVFSMGGLVVNTFSGTCDSVRANVSTAGNCS